jgi:hypothetical protein
MRLWLKFRPLLYGQCSGGSLKSLDSELQVALDDEELNFSPLVRLVTVTVRLTR